MSAAGASGTPAAGLLPELAAATGHVFWRASARVDAVLAEVLPPGVDVHAYATLIALEDGRARSQQWLAGTILVSRTTMTKVAADLAAQDLVERARNPADRRSYALTVTAAGRSARAAWAPHVRAVETRLLDVLPAAERAELHRLLLAVAQSLLSPQLPPELPASAGFLVGRLHRRMHADVMEALRDLGLEPRHLGSLLVLESAGPVAQADLARHLGVSGPTVVEIADHLEGVGLVERRRLDTDRRTHALHLLPDADRVAREARRRGTVAVRALLASITPTEQARLTALLARIVIGG